VKITNYIAIRFSLIIPAWLEKAYAGGTREEWFRSRCALFRRWTAASIDAQTVPPRGVLILMDIADRPLWDAYLHLPAPYLPVFCELGDSDAAVAAAIHDREGDDARNVMLSRVDSDDALASNYLEELNRTARASVTRDRPKFYIVACNGLISDLSKTQTIYCNCCPFISIFVSDYRGEGIYDFEHEKVLERQPVLNLTAVWMQVLHGTNIANKLHRTSRYEPGDERVMLFGPDMPAAATWPAAFPPLTAPAAGPDRALRQARRKARRERRLRAEGSGP
jgi:hypothetical protein